MIHAPPARARRRRAGASLLELLVALAVVAVLLGVSVQRFSRAAGARAARAAARDVAEVLASARLLARTNLEGAAVHFAANTGVVRVRVGGRLVRSVPIGAHHGVTLDVTRDTLAYDARGLGHGAANLRIVLARGASAETLVVSRLGRVRGPHW